MGCESELDILAALGPFRGRELPLAQHAMNAVLLPAALATARLTAAAGQLKRSILSVDRACTEQRFFIAFAQGWRTNQRAEQRRLQISSDVHSPIRRRVLGPVPDFPEFRAAFGCPDATAPTPVISRGHR